VQDPDQAAPDAKTISLLSELSHCLQRVVIISGRDTDFLAARLPLTSALFIGNHGLEERDGGKSLVVAEARPYLERLRRAGDAVEALPLARTPGITTERKRATVSVHFRRATDPSASGAALQPELATIARREELTLLAGRFVWELRPPTTIDKGEVLRRLAVQLRPAGIIYIGDDRTDADAFRALKRMAGIKTVAVGVRSAEVANEVFDDCDLVVDGVPGVVLLLARLRDLCATA
jgi:trehalose 6-phosphate phosphatase